MKPFDRLPWPRISFVAPLAAVALALGLQPSAVHADSAPTDSFAVATETQAATRAAIATLRAGGNAVDAAITAALVLGVVNPTSSGLGGGGFALVFDSRTQRVTALDFRESAPRGIDPRSLDARPVDELSRGVLTGVPGEAAGLAELHKRWGRRTFLQDAQPAIHAAESGFAIERHLARSLRSNRARLQASLALTDRFLRRGQPLDTGARLTNPQLARTLRSLGSSGPNAFYQGPVAAEIARATQAYGGSLDTDDLAAYHVIERTPLHVAWNGHDVFTMPPPSAGGLLLAQTLLMHDRASLTALGADSPAYIHLLAETFRGAVSDRIRAVGDPDAVTVPMATLLSTEHLRARRARIRSDQTHEPSNFQLPEHGTMHLVVVDRERNVVALTSTVNNAFGTRIVAPECGVILNDELDDFTPLKTARLFGFSDGGPNAPRAGARPVSSMTPTIVVDGGTPVLALGGSGGVLIPTGVTEVLLRALAFDTSAERAVAAPRFSVSVGGPSLLIEPEWISEAQERQLRTMGEPIMPLTLPTAVQAVRMRSNGRMEAGADPRKFGLGMVVR